METRLVQLRARGTLTLPVRMRERYALENGDPVTLVDLDGAILLAPRISIATKLAAEIEYLRSRSGLSLEDLLAGVKEQRARYVAERLEHGEF